MRRFLIVMAAVVSALVMNACEEDKWGYDNRVVFEAYGGEEDVDGDAPVYTLSIGNHEGDEKEAVEVDGVLTVTYDWLTATVVKGDDEIRLVAEPNTTGKSRKLYLYGMVFNNVMDVTVIQKR